jgi:hypothetical protein
VVGRMEIKEDETTRVQTLAELWLVEQFGSMEEIRRKNMSADLWVRS